MARTRIARTSAATKQSIPDRQRCRAIVLARDKRCVAIGIPGVPHGLAHGRTDLEVHELKRGKARREVWLDPDWCVALCPQAHEWATDAGRLTVEAVGLAVASWAPSDAWADAQAIRHALHTGANPSTPSWWGPVDEQDFSATRA